MANADGGTLVLGLEDDGTPTGVPYRARHLKEVETAPSRLIIPPLKPRLTRTELEGCPILIFEVDWSPEVHQLTDGRYLLRIQDSNQPFRAEDIIALKSGKARRLTELRLFPDASPSDLDADLLNELRRRTGLELDDEELLLHYRLAEQRDRRLILTLAALLLFSRDPVKWHSACYVDFVKWEGTDRRFGKELNVVKRRRIEGALPRLIERTFQVIRSHIRERQYLVNLFFEERFEYPTFAWQEAIINAVAHRDYALEGTPIEIWMFDDRLEIRSPGRLVPPVTVDLLQRRERIHASRNPRIVRVLTDWGFMRELGEGIPRMFEVMEQEGLHPPDLKLEAGSIFTVILRNAPIYSPEVIQWMKQFKYRSLNPNQKRLLAYAYSQGGYFTSRQYQKLVGIDIYTASKDIKDLIRKGIVRLTKKRGRIYKVIEAEEGEVPVPPELREAWKKIKPVLREKGQITNSDVRNLLHLPRHKSSRLLNSLVRIGLLRQQGKGRGVHYVLIGNEPVFGENERV
jgi:ATP-dependent DNA helicase RecG